MINIAEIWDYVGALARKESYVELLKDVLELDGSQVVLDVCAGSGFPALQLAKHTNNLILNEVDPRMREILQRKGLRADYAQRWENLTIREDIDVVLCLGNSLIYAAGGWKEDLHKDPYAAIEKAIKRFAELLPVGGLLVVDKFPDSERDGSWKGSLHGLPVELEHTRSNKWRTVTFRYMNDKQSLNAPDLKEHELMDMLKKYFSHVIEILLPTDFVTYLAKK